MKNLNLIMILALSIMLVIATASISQAAVSGACSMCHTMHNSQNGAYMAEDDTGTLSATVHDYLTRGSCLGCHGLGNTTIGNAPNVFGVPGSTMCAGGTFNATYVDTDPNAYSNVHNVKDITWTNPEIYFASNPPGATTDSLGDGIIVGSNFSCAGLYGCHGDHDPNKTTSALGIKGFHHGSTAYRYCQLEDDTEIIGKGSSNWEGDIGGASATNHNVYSASSTAGISKFCAECHGDFHGEANTGSSSPFERHPTDNLLFDAGWTLTSVTINYNSNPFAFDGTAYDAEDPNSAYVIGIAGARVACVSCHRAHGTPYADILRFDYNTQTAGSSTNYGCLGCHYSQRSP